MKRILFANRSSRFGYWLITMGTILAGCGSPDDKVSPDRLLLQSLPPHQPASPPS